MNVKSKRDKKRREGEKKKERKGEREKEDKEGKALERTEGVLKTLANETPGVLRTVDSLTAYFSSLLLIAIRIHREIGRRISMI